MNLVAPPSPDLEDPAGSDRDNAVIQDAVIREARRRARRRRRTWGGFVAVLTLALAAVVALDRPAPPLGSPATADGVGFVGPPPPGSPPTGPATGKIVAAAQFWMGTWVYADGRIINYDSASLTDEFPGMVVRQLTPSGVKAMRSYLLDGRPRLIPLSDNGGRLIVRVGGRLMEDRNYTGCVSEGQSRYCPIFSHPEDWLPASAWEDPTFRPFVPHSYQVCLWSPRRSSPAELLPSRAADILLASPENATPRETCSVLDNLVARELADIMDKAGSSYARHKEESEVLPFDLTYELPRSATLGFQPELPHDDAFCWPGGNPC